jgi:hypothetical protein
MNKFFEDGAERNKVSVDQVNRRWISVKSGLRITGNQNIRIYYLEKAQKQEDNRLKIQYARQKGI